MSKDFQFTPLCRFVPLNPLNDLESGSLKDKLNFPIPFQIPPPRYAAGRKSNVLIPLRILDQKPWIVDKLYPEPDIRGFQWFPAV